MGTRDQAELMLSEANLPHILHSQLLIQDSRRTLTMPGRGKVLAGKPCGGDTRRQMSGSYRMRYSTNSRRREKPQAATSSPSSETRSALSSGLGDSCASCRQGECRERDA